MNWWMTLINVVLYPWMDMKTFCNEEPPFKITLTFNGLDCIDVLFKLWPVTYDEVIENRNLSMSIYEPENKDTLLKENTKTKMENKNSISNDFIFLDIETISTRDSEIHKCFYTKSESIYIIHLKDQLWVGYVQLLMVPDMIGLIVVMYNENLQRWYGATTHEIFPNGTATCYVLDDDIYDLCYEFYQPTDFLWECPPTVWCCSLYTPKLVDKEDEIWFLNVDEMFKDIATISLISFLFYFIM